jgi:hypothetical protein
MSVLGRLLKPMFEVSTDDLPALGVDNDTTRRLHRVVDTVTECCRTTLFHSRFPALVPRLDAYDQELRGFAYEGAGVGLAALDSLAPWRARTREFVAGPGAEWAFAVYLGAGMGLARLRRNPDAFRKRLRDPLLGWVVLDGYGFHEGFFAHRRTVRERVVPARITGYGRRAFDHGLGRSIWFTTGADVAAVVATIGTFDAARHADLWSGVGMACGYTGGVPRSTIEELRAGAGPRLADLAVGVAVAAKMRHQVDNPVLHNDDACAVLCGLTSAEAAAVADAAQQNLPTHGTEPAYETWRRRIRERLARSAGEPARPEETPSWR